MTQPLRADVRDDVDVDLRGPERRAVAGVLVTRVRVASPALPGFPLALGREAPFNR